MIELRNGSHVGVVVTALVALVVGAVLWVGRAEGWTATARSAEVVEHGRMGTPRAAHQATALADGRVLITGGCGDPGCESMLASAEIYDASTASFEPVEAMSVGRGSHEATLLSDGRVLVTGGWTDDGPSASAEIWDPANRAWRPIGSMTEPRVSHNAVALPDGRLLIVGGDEPLQTAEVFDPATERFAPMAPLLEEAGSYLPVALTDGRVLITGGRTASAQVFDPAAERFEPAGDLQGVRTKHGAALLADGRVLLVGGSREGGYADRRAATELYDPRRGVFVPGPSMAHRRFKIRDAVVALPNGDVLIAGGAPSAELWDRDSQAFRRVPGDFGAPRMFATATLLSTGDVLVLGGYDERIRPTDSAWLFDASR